MYYTPIWWVSPGIYLSGRESGFYLHWSDGYQMPISYADAIHYIYTVCGKIHKS